jgi:tetratricopeptide (TPR) repeat protein
MVPTQAQETLEWLIKTEDFATARSLAQSVFRFLDQTQASSFDFLGSILFRSKFYREAMEASDRTLVLAPKSPEARFNAGKCSYFSGFPEKAERLMREACEMRTGWADPKIDLAMYICAQGRFDEAHRLLQELMVTLPPTDRNVDVVKFNLGWHEIRQGKFKEGISDLGIGRKLRIWGARSHSYPKPELQDFTEIRNKTILLCGEGGFGDEMINARFGQVIRDRGGKAIWLTTGPLKSLLSRTPGLERVITPKELSHSDYDFWAPCMDLPRILGMDLHDIPNRPYISADPNYVKKWRDRIRAPGKFKVGLRWKGNALYEQDLMRSVPFKRLERMADISDVEFYSLQRDEGIEERSVDSPVIDWGTAFESWEDTAGAIENLDLVISSCTSVPHLSAAMGKSTWLFCPLNCYYLWASPGENSPWYPSVRLFRQKKYGTWDECLNEVCERLLEMRRSVKVI